MDYGLLQKVNSPSDLKKLQKSELEQYAYQVRAFITQNVIKNGGHLAPSLGVVDITIALHYIYNAPSDKIIWDVGHQTYAHKIITGRRDSFDTLRMTGGISGFPKASESEYDHVTTGHSSTSLSLALGLCHARDTLNEKHKVVAVVGDGAIAGGMSFEALNDIGGADNDILVILNDNNMSISKNVGGLSNYFSKMRISKKYRKFKVNLKRAVSALPFFGDKVLYLLNKSRSVVKSVAKTNKMFEQMGFKYYGPYDGNNIEVVLDVLNQTKSIKGPVLLHLNTIKGCGFEEAEKNPSAYHGIDKPGTDTVEKFSSVVSSTLCELASANDKICTITAAMGTGTGLYEFSQKYPERHYDVGIAEQHAVGLASGLSLGGLKPYFAVYSTFLQRGYDQILHDVCINNLPVTFLIDRAGVVGADGVTHQGVFDIAYLSNIPNITILSPRDGNELKKMIEFSVGYDKPLAIRYPKNYVTNGEKTNTSVLKWENIRTNSNADSVILSVGNRMLNIALQTTNAEIIDARAIKPLDYKCLDSIATKYKKLITLEDGVFCGGFGSCVLNYINEKNYNTKVYNFAIKDEFVETLDISKAIEENGISTKNIQQVIDK